MEVKNPADLVPSPYGKLFTMYDSFNAMQTKLLNDLLYTDKSIVLSAPTGSGKTVAFELAIVRMLLENDRLQSINKNDKSISSKAIYIAPIKALCSERYVNWKARFDTVGINCTQLTGDTQSANLMAIRQAQIVISTPEKWDSITRRWRDFENLLPAVKLFIVDEVHLLNEDTRGPILEAIVTRMKSSGVQRFLVASATIPNVEDLTSWIGSCNTSVAQYVFNEMQRPVPLEKHVLGFNTKLKGFQFDMKLNYQLPQIIRKYAEQKAALIFCSSRKSAEMAAINLNKSSSIFTLSDQQKTYLHQLSTRLIDTKLKKLVGNGFAYHHAGLQYADRILIETSFREGFLMVLLSTSTLAMGINLPAHLVIIKSTETYMRGGYAEYPENMLLQMIGRAGRLQYDTKGIAVILTQTNKVEKYKKILHGKAPIESHLHKHLTEHLNSEIALNSINNLKVAMDWIRSTYLYVRAVRNPNHYGFSANMSKDFVEHKLEELSFKQINALESAGLVIINKENGFDVQTTPIGKLMAKYYLCFETMKLFRELTGNETLQNVFDLLVQCKELNEFTLRVNEKKILNSLNKTPIRFPIKGRIKKCEDKISCIIQAALGNLDIPSVGLVQESLKIFRIGERVSKCLLEYVRLCVQKNLYSKLENSWYKTLLNSFIIAKCFHVKLWENSEYASKQLHGIGTVYSTLLLNAGKTTLKEIAKTEARTIECILNKPAPFGDEVLQNLLTFPEYEIKLTRQSNDILAIYAKQVNENYVHKSGGLAVLIVGDSMNNLLLLAENFDGISTEYGCFERTVKIQNPKDVEYIYGHVIHTSLVGVDAHDTLEINAPKVIKKEKATKKSKKQTRLCVTHNETLNDTDFMPDNTLNKDTNDTSELPIDTCKSKLKRFQFTKLKIHHDEHNKTKIDDETIKEDDNPPKIATIKPLNEKHSIEERNEHNVSNINRSVQRKLTEFFAQRKKTDFTESVDLTKEDEKKLGTQNVRSQPLEKGVCLDNNDNDNTQKTEHTITTLNKKNLSHRIDENLSDAENTLSISELLRQIKKRKSTDNEVQPPAKKRQFQNDFNTGNPYKQCPISLASFLGDIGQVHTVTSLLAHENYNKNSEKQQCSAIKPIEAIFEAETNSSYKLNSVTASKHIENAALDVSCRYKQQQNPYIIASPLDLSKKFYKYQHTAAPPEILNASTLATSSKSEKTYGNPTEEDFALWFKVAMKFQRLPTQAMSLKNFRHVYNKVMAKEQIKQTPQMSPQTSKSSQKKTNSPLKGNNSPYDVKLIPKNTRASMETSHSSSSTNSFRLKLFNNDENSTKNISPSTVKRINQNVMKFVLNSKCVHNLKNDDFLFDDNLSVALKDIEKELSYESV